MSSSPFHYQGGKLHFNDICLNTITSKQKTPFYLYSKKLLSSNYTDFRDGALNAGMTNPKVCFAMKSNSNLQVLKTLKKLGAGADIVSGGELKLALEAGFKGSDIVFSGVGKTDVEIRHALKSNIFSFNVESVEELEQINIEAKKLNKIANISFRLNPQVIAKTHKHISTGNKTHKFGILSADIIKAARSKKLWSHAKLKGISIHIGSQLTCLKATNQAIINLCDCASEISRVKNHTIEFLDVGGGLGIDYHPEQKNTIPSINEYMELVQKTITENYKDEVQIVFEPGRIIAARAGAFITKVIRTKVSEGYHFLIVDGGMNDFVRPSLYNAYHEIYSSKKINAKTKVVATDIVGPICETADCFGTNRKLPLLKKDDFIAIADTGAYGHTMSSNYNMREKPKEYFK